jgi:hypothetical protein
MAKKPLNAGIQFERDFIKVAQAAGFSTEKLSTPTPPMRPFTCGAVPRSSFTTKRPYDVLLVRDHEGLQVGQLRGFRVFAVECKSSGKEPRLALDRIQPHQIKGLNDRGRQGWQAGLAIDLPRPAAEGEREWWWLPAYQIEQMVSACEKAGRKSATWKELQAAGAVQLAQNPLAFAESIGAY